MKRSLPLLLAVFLLAGCAAPPSQLAATEVLGPDDARHLLVRTGFGATADDVAAYAGLTREEAVSRLLRETRTVAVTPPPEWTLEAGPLRVPRVAAGATEAQRKAFRAQQLREALALRGWWVREMLATPSPLTERMTLFWHNHFTSSQQKVRFARLMYAQNATLRANALGSFTTLLHAMARDPAMVVYLDEAQNRKGVPNENFARELMELFTLGEGHYGEQDVKEAARAFTGWSIDRDSGRFLFRRRLHDDGIKTIFGHRGNFDGDDVLDLLLARPETATFIVDKLWREFVSPTPDPAAVARIADDFRATRYDIKVAFHGLLVSDAFFAADNRGTLVKSPVDLVVGTLRTLEITPPATVPYALAAAGMSQNLFSPPNVKGWPGGDAWINSSTLLARKQFLAGVARARSEAAMDETAQPAAPGERAMMRVDFALRALSFDAAAWVARQPGATPSDRLRAAQRLLLPLPPVTPDVAEAMSEREAGALVRAALLDPVYELK